MAEIVNLRRFRKSKARSKDAAAADENRARYGRSAAESRAETGEAARRKAALDGHRLEKLRPGHDETTDG